MAKLTTITIDNKLYDIGEIKRVSNLPSAITIDSPEIIIYNNELYIKHFTNGVYSYKNFAPPLTAGENISISDDGVISVTGELGTQIEANPELSGDETKLSSISIDGVNYEIGGSNDTNKVDLSTPFTSMGEIVIAQDTTSVKGSGVKVSDLATKSDLDDLTTTSEVNTAIANNLIGAVSTIKTSNLTTSRVLVSDASGKVAASSNVTTTELGYLDGVTSSIQTQLNAKQSTLIAGDNITIAADGTISAADGTVAYVEDDEILVLEEGTASGGSSTSSGSKIIDITDWFSSDVEGIVPEKYRNEKLLQQSILYSRELYHAYRFDGYCNFTDDQELTFTHIQTHDSDNMVVFHLTINIDWRFSISEVWNFDSRINEKISITVNDDDTIDVTIN